MSKDATTPAPSRRTIAKGAAWALPAVSVAAVAPALAASTTACPAGTLRVTVSCPPLLSTKQLYFTITNPDDTCSVPAGTTFTVDRGGLAGVAVGDLNSLNVNANVIFNTANQGELTEDLGPGESMDVQVFPRGLARVSALQRVTLTIAGASATQGYTIISVARLSVAICGLG